MDQLEVSKSLKEESTASDMQHVNVKSNESGCKRSLMVSRETLMKELGEKAEEAQELLTSKASGGEHGVPSTDTHHTKRTLRLERRLSTITEESRSYSDSIRSNSVQSNTGCRRQLPGFYNPLRLNAKIANFDSLLDKKDAVHSSYRKRLGEVRGVFDDFRCYRIRRDTPSVLNLQKLDIEVQVAQIAQRNVKESTHLLLNTNVGTEIKGMMRRYLHASEEAARPDPHRKNKEVLEEMKSFASSIARTLESTPSKLSVAVPGIDKLTARRDVEEVREYLRHIFHLRYQHVPLDHRDEYCSRTIVNRVKPLATYLRWQITGDDGVAVGLARALGLHVVELDALLRPRLENVLLLVNVDAEYVKDRLMDSEHLWHWVYEHNPLAHNAQWPKLARQFLADREQLNRIFPEEIIYSDPELGIENSNLKAMVRVGMIQLQGHYFAKIDSPDRYKLSKNAKRIDHRHRRGEERLRREMEESGRIRKELIRQARYERYNPKGDSMSMEKLAAARGYSPECPTFEPSTRNRLKRWVSRARDAMVIRQRSTIRS
ncbi:MAG: hypothetical protein Q9211_004570 [Gyalolechia sp. 1 TL-2023]